MEFFMRHSSRLLIQSLAPQNSHRVLKYHRKQSIQRIQTVHHENGWHFD